MSDLTGKKIQVLSKLSKKEQVSFLALEYTGHGKSSGQLSDYGIDDWINQSKELIEKVVKKKKITNKDLYAYNVYQIEGEGRNLFSKIEGDEDTIMGLPVKKIKEYLNIIK